MPKKSFAAMALVALWAVPATALVATGTSAGASSPVTIQANLCYQSSHGSCVDGASHEMDAYLPTGATQKTPGVILVHGGSFVGGDKANVTAIADVLAQDGMAAFSINYRLDSPTVAGYPMEVQDVMAAVGYVRAHAGTYDVDPTRLALFGSSAGATLAVQAGVQAFQNDPSAQVRALVGWSGG
jgi:acetyl esterase